MQNGDQRLNAMSQHFIKHFIVERKTRLIWLSVISVLEDSCPGNGEPQYLETHFCKQGNVFFVVVIEISGHMAGIVIAFF